MTTDRDNGAEVEQAQACCSAAKNHPLQPILVDGDGTRRFKPNKIVRYLLEAGPFDMNQLALMPFDNEDREQFAQLIGYSVSGFSDLGYASDETVRAAEAQESCMASASKRDDGADAGRPGPDETTDVQTGEIHDALLATLSDAISSLTEAENLVDRYRDLGRMGRKVAAEWVHELARSIYIVREQIEDC